MFSSEFCKIFKNTFFTEHIWATASAHVMNLLLSLILESVSMIIILICCKYMTIIFSKSVSDLLFVQIVSYCIGKKHLKKYLFKREYISKICDSKELFGYIAIRKYWNSHQRCSMKKGVLRNFAKFTGNTCARAVFLWSLQNFYKHLFYRTRPDDCFLNKSFFWKKQMGIQLKRICHQITKFVEYFVRKGYHICYNSIVTENIYTNQQSFM